MRTEFTVSRIRCAACLVQCKVFDIRTRLSRLNVYFLPSLRSLRITFLTRVYLTTSQKYWGSGQVKHGDIRWLCCVSAQTLGASAITFYIQTTTVYYSVQEKKIDEAFTYRFVHRGFVKIVGFYFQSVFVADYNLVYEIKISISALKIDHLIDSRDADQDTRNAPLCVLRSKAHWGEGTCLIALEKRRRHLNRFHRLWTNIVFTTSLMLFLYHVVTEWDCQFFLSV